MPARRPVLSRSARVNQINSFKNHSEEKVMAKQNQKIEAAVKARQQQLETALSEIIDTIEHYYGAAHFEFAEGENAEPGQYAFPRPDDGWWTERWMGLIDPSTVEIRAKGDPECELRFYTQRLGFYVGVFVGAKFMGASRDDLEKKAQGFVRFKMGEARWRAEQ